MNTDERSETIIHVDDRDYSKTIVCRLAGVTYPNPEYKIVRYPSKQSVFEFVKSGRGFIEYKNNISPVCAGTFYLIKKDVDVTCFSDPDEPYEKIWFAADGEMLSRVIDMFVTDGVYMSHTDVLKPFMEIHSRLRSATKPDSPDMYADIMCIIFRIITEATKDIYFPNDTEKNALDEKIRSYIDSNIYTDVSLEKISEVFGITEMHIIRVFKKKFGITPMQYLIDRKISVAQSLLTSTVMPIKEIAAILRYSNTQHFSSSFKTAVGCTPNKYRQAQK